MGNPEKSYDQIQKEAVLTQCSQCRRLFYMTVRRDLCVECLDLAWVKSIAEPGEKVTR